MWSTSSPSQQYLLRHRAGVEAPRARRLDRIDLGEPDGLGRLDHNELEQGLRPQFCQNKAPAWTQQTPSPQKYANQHEVSSSVIQTQHTVTVQIQHTVTA